MINRPLTAIAAAALLIGVAVPVAVGASSNNDCNRVASADRTLCRKVQLQHSYGRTFDGHREGAWTEPSGKTLVHQITHSGYTQRQMHDALVAEAKSYQLNVTAVPVSVDAIGQQCGTAGGQWVISLVDADGRPGGTQLTWKRVACR